LYQNAKDLAQILDKETKKLEHKLMTINRKSSQKAGYQGPAMPKTQGRQNPISTLGSSQAPPGTSPQSLPFHPLRPIHGPPRAGPQSTPSKEMVDEFVMQRPTAFDTEINYNDQLVETIKNKLDIMSGL